MFGILRVHHGFEDRATLRKRSKHVSVIPESYLAIPNVREAQVHHGFEDRSPLRKSSRHVSVIPESRMSYLAIPNVREAPNTRRLPQPIKKSTLNYKPSHRIINLARPNYKCDILTRPYPHDISPKTLHYKPSDRINNLAQPIDYEEVRRRTIFHLKQIYGKTKFRKRRTSKPANKRKRRRSKRRKRRRSLRRTLNSQDVLKTEEHLTRLAQPRPIHVVLELKLPQKVNPAALNYEPTENIVKLACPRKVISNVENFIAERIKSHDEVLKRLNRKTGVKKYENFQDGEHINHLAQPKIRQEPHELDFELPRKVNPAALTYEASENLLKLATPKKNWAPEPKPLRTLSEILAQKYVMSERLEQLAKPKRLFCEFENRLPSKPSSKAEIEVEKEPSLIKTTVSNAEME